MAGIEAVSKLMGKGFDLADKAITDKDKLNDIKSNIILAEINSDSSYLKNARPSITYTGIFVIVSEVFGFRLSVLDWIDATAAMIESSTSIVTYFLVVWGGVVGTTSYGRSGEKKTKNTLIQHKEAAIEIEKMKLEAEIYKEEILLSEEVKENRAKRRANRQPIFKRKKG